AIVVSGRLHPAVPDRGHSGGEPGRSAERGHHAGDVASHAPDAQVHGPSNLAVVQPLREQRDHLSLPGLDAVVVSCLAHRWHVHHEVHNGLILSAQTVSCLYRITPGNVHSIDLGEQRPFVISDHWSPFLRCQPTLSLPLSSPRSCSPDDIQWHHGNKLPTPPA